MRKSVLRCRELATPGRIQIGNEGCMPYEDNLNERISGQGQLVYEQNNVCISVWKDELTIGNYRYKDVKGEENA